MSFDWTEEALAKVAQMVIDGKSGSQIGAHFGVSRNAIIGVVARRIKGVKLGRHTHAERPSPVIRAGTAKPQPRPHLPPRPRQRKAVKAPPIVVARQELVLAPMTFLDAVNADRCLYFADNPMSEDGPDMPVCGAERAHEPHETRYCPYHVKRQGYVSMQEAG